MWKGILLRSPPSTLTAAPPNLLCLPGSWRFEVSFDPKLRSMKSDSLHLGCAQPLLPSSLWSCLSAARFSVPLFSLLRVLLTATPQLPLPSPQALAFGSTKPNREAEMPVMLIRYSTSNPSAGDTGSERGLAGGDEGCFPLPSIPRALPHEANCSSLPWPQG